MKDSVRIEALLDIIRTLPADAPADHPGKWYRTQKEHWIGWLSEYHGSGAYGRQTGVTRDARFAYNHVVDAEMLLWLIDAAGVDPDLAAAACEASATGATLMQKSAAIRRLVPWETVAAALWPASQPGARSAHSGNVRRFLLSALTWARFRR